MALLLTHGGSALAVDVRQTMWGFDGQVVVQRFNIFSILVDNPSANSFEGEIRLTKMVAGKQVDAPIVETMYLGPYQSRWVQLYPYVKSNWETWRVSWGTSAGTSFDPPEPRLGSPAAVLLDDPDGIPQTGGVVAIKRLPDNLFPPHVTATDCLAAVVMDHVPRWDPARQRSFLDWLKRGGRVYLLKSTEGHSVEFTGELQVLNGTADKSRVGSGSVLRVDRTRRQLDAGFVKLVVEQEGQFSSGEEPGVGAETKPEPTVDDPDSPLYGYQFSHMKWDPESALLSHLQKLSTPNHSWWLIFALGLLYLGTLFPGCYTVAWKYKGDIRYTFGFLVAGVLLFSLVFLFVGRRGYNEVTVVHSVALARQQPGGTTLDVTQWSNAFVTEGGDYNLEHVGTSRIYSACQDRERVNKEIRNGADAHLLADMPPFSSRPFAHRAIVAAQPIDVAVEEWSTIADLSPATTNVRDIRKATVRRPARELKTLKLRKGKSFPAAPQNIYAVCGRRLYQLRDQGTHVVLDKEAGTLGGVLHVDQFSEFNNSFKYQPQQQPFAPTPWREPKPADILAEMFYPLLARCLELNDQKEVELFVLPTDRIRLVVYAPLPENLQLSNPQFNRQHGFVLYSLDLFEPETQ